MEESASVKVLSQLLNGREGAGGQQHRAGTCRALPCRGGAPLTAPADDGDHSWGPPGEGGSARTPLSWVGTQCSGGIQAHTESFWPASGAGGVAPGGAPVGCSPWHRAVLLRLQPELCFGVFCCVFMSVAEREEQFGCVGAAALSPPAQGPRSHPHRPELLLLLLSRIRLCRN